MKDIRNFIVLWTLSNGMLPCSIGCLALLLLTILLTR